MAHFIQLKPSQITWDSPTQSFSEYNSTPGNYRRFFSTCGSTMTWRGDCFPDEIEVMTGSLDEKWLIGDRTARVASEEFAEKGRWKSMMDEEDKSGVTKLGKELCTPDEEFWFRNAIIGVTDSNAAGKKMVEGSELALSIYLFIYLFILGHRSLKLRQLSEIPNNRVSLFVSEIMRRDRHPAHPQLTVSNSDNDSTLLAVTVAAVLFAAGSAFIIRSRRRTLDTKQLCSSQMLCPPATASSQPDASVPEKSNLGLLSPDIDIVPRVNDAGEQTDHSCDSKKSRSKERRRRGKDPLKEILKGGKKNKLPSKLSGPMVADIDGNRTASPPATLSRLTEPGTSQDSRESSVAASSPTSPSSDLEPVDMSDTTTSSGSKQSPLPGSFEPRKDSNVESLDVSTPTADLGASKTRDGPASTPSHPIFSLLNGDESKEISPVLGPPDTSHPPSGPVPPAFDSTLPPSHSLFSFEINEPQHIASSHSMPPYISSFQSTTHPPPLKLGTDTRKINAGSAHKFNSPWDWDGQSSPSHETTYQKPPRFRSKSRVSSSSSISASMSYNIPFTPTTSYSPVTSPSLMMESLPPNPPASLPSHLTQNADLSRPFIYPTLNSPSPSQSPAPYPNGYLNLGNMSLGTNPSGNSHRTSMARQTSTSTLSGDSTPPPVSVQTHIASLKGALEAARAREEKSRLEAEHYAKEYEMLRWRWAEDSVTWRRRETEVRCPPPFQ